MEEIINNIMQSPENTNPNVLRSQLQGISGGSGGGALVVTVAPAENGANNGGKKGSGGGGEPIYIADKTVAEIKAGLLAGNVVVQFVDHEFINANDIYAVISVEWNDKHSNWEVVINYSYLVAQSMDDYPQLEK